MRHWKIDENEQRWSGEDSYLLVNRKTGTPKLLTQVHWAHAQSSPSMQCGFNCSFLNHHLQKSRKVFDTTARHNCATQLFSLQVKYFSGEIITRCKMRTFLVLKKGILQPRSQSLSLSPHCENEVQDISLAVKNASPTERGSRLLRWPQLIE